MAVLTYLILFRPGPSVSGLAAQTGHKLTVVGMGIFQCHPKSSLSVSPAFDESFFEEEWLINIIVKAKGH